MKIRFSLFLVATLINRSYGQSLTWEDESSARCATPDGNTGECLNIKQCPTLLELLRNSRKDLAAANFLRKSLCGYENKDPKVCCSSSQPTTSTITNVITPASEPLVTKSGDDTPDTTPASTTSASTTVTTTTTTTTTRPTTTTATTTTTRPTTTTTTTTTTRPTTSPTTRPTTTFTITTSTTTPATNPATSPATNTVTTPATSSTSETTPIINTNKNYEYKSLAFSSCGNTSVPQNEIIEGQAKLGAWPWVALLGYRSTADRKTPPPHFLCSGTLVSARHVLTAAHCNELITLQMYMVRFGVNDRKSDVKPTDVNIKTIITHALYEQSPRHYDIAILRLVEEVPFSKNVQPICLPIAPELREMTFERNLGLVTGWTSRYVKYNKDKSLVQLQLSIISNEQCQKAYEDTEDIRPVQMCADFLPNQEESCQGESGSSLVWKGAEDIYYLIGIVSYGYSCGRPGFVSVYTRITSLLDWLEIYMK